MPVLRIPVNAGFSCPNRDGTKSLNGCLFCDNRSFSPVATAREHSVYNQIITAINRNRYRFSAFIPYFQPFTNTYGPPRLLRSVYDPLVSIPGVVGIAIGTRPDCLGNEVVEYLDELNRATYLNVEIGFQSGSDSVLARVNRGHDVGDFIGSVERLARFGIEKTAHVILGLPGDTLATIAKTASLLARLPVEGVKIHQLMIIAGTPIMEMHEHGECPVLEIEEYGHLLALFLSLLRPDQFIHRIMADSTVENGLVAPLWCKSENKARAINWLHSYLGDEKVFQGQGSNWQNNK